MSDLMAHVYYIEDEIEPQSVHEYDESSGD
jgi:hypothetical protein